MHTIPYACMVETGTCSVMKLKLSLHGIVLYMYSCCYGNSNLQTSTYSLDVQNCMCLAVRGDLYIVWGPGSLQCGAVCTV